MGVRVGAGKKRFNKNKYIIFKLRVDDINFNINIYKLLMCGFYSNDLNKRFDFIILKIWIYVEPLNNIRRFSLNVFSLI